MHDLTGAVVVGYDGSPASDAAVDWAAAEAGRRRTALALVYCTELPSVLLVDEIVASVTSPEMQEAAAGVVDAGVARALRTTYDVLGITETGVAADVLVSLSRDADLLVVGHRGRGGWRGALLGSVAFAVTAHAHGPVVVVHGHSDREAGPDWPVVVGVDGPGSTAAVEFGARAAARSGALLLLVAAYHLPTHGVWSGGYWNTTSPGPEVAELGRRDAEATLRLAAHAALRECPTVRLDTSAREGEEVHVLVGASHSAALLVAGSRGRSGIPALVLGSVSRSLCHAAQCPTVVVRATSRTKHTETGPLPAALSRG